MTRLEKCEILKNKGYTYNSDTGKIYGVYGKEIVNLDKNGYTYLPLNLRGHHFAFYMTYGNVEFEQLDHINRNKTDNRIVNLRSVSNQQNNFNRFGKGYSFDKRRNKWHSRIMINGKNKHLGSYDNEEEARESYLTAKSIYHNLI